jgi:hypothetical protein
MDPESNGAARSTRAVQNRTDLAARAAEVADSDGQAPAAHIRLSSGHEGSVALPTVAGRSGAANVEVNKYAKGSRLKGTISSALVAVELDKRGVSYSGSPRTGLEFRRPDGKLAFFQGGTLSCNTQGPTISA